MQIQNNPDTITHIISLCGNRSSCDTESSAQPRTLVKDVAEDFERDEQ